MGAVYQAWDAELGVAVALKVIRTEARRRAGVGRSRVLAAIMRGAARLGSK
jgi:hypothetical protein